MSGLIECSYSKDDSSILLYSDSLDNSNKLTPLIDPHNEILSNTSLMFKLSWKFIDNFYINI